MEQESVVVCFPDVPGAQITGSEDAVIKLIVKLTAGMDAAQLNRMLLYAELYARVRIPP